MTHHMLRLAALGLAIAAGLAVHPASERNAHAVMQAVPAETRDLG